MLGWAILAESPGLSENWYRVEHQHRTLYLFPCINAACEFETHWTSCLEKHNPEEALVSAVVSDSGVLGALECSHCVNKK